MMKHITTGRWKLGLLLSFVTAFLWGITPIAIKIVLEDMDPYTIAWYRFFVSAICVGIWIFRKHGIPDIRIFRGPVLWLTLMATMGLGANYAFFMVGLNYIPPSTAAVVIQLAPVFLLLGSIFIFKESFGLYQFLGFFILLIGLICFFNMRSSFLLSGFSSYAMGVLLIVCAAIVWAVYALAQKQLLISLPSEIVLLFVYTGCVILFTPFSNPGKIIHLKYLHLLLLIFICFNTFVAYGSFSESLNHLEASRVSMVLAIIPLITIGSMTVISFMFPGRMDVEPLNIISIIGGILVVFGSMVGSLFRKNTA